MTSMTSIRRKRVNEPSQYKETHSCYTLLPPYRDEEVAAGRRVQFHPGHMVIYGSHWTEQQHLSISIH